MNARESAIWKDETRRNAGRWRVDPCHAGTAKAKGERDLLLYRTDPSNVTCGHYIIVVDVKINIGRYEGAFDAITDGEFFSFWSSEYPSFAEAVKIATAILHLGYPSATA